ncbi:hypothetical protein [Thermoactinospora rubra]|uniref:hypothetical protein n=1 Tax=Thermoactinospora rubra TaxID=1088767 RepID=UPI00118007CE|nr:hypothetical protein [Thermoactinospora rubra]
MRLTWKDAVAAAVTGTIVALYVAFLQGAQLPLLGSVRGTAGAVLLLGIVGGCAMSRGDALTEPRSTERHVYVVLTGTLGVVALGAAVSRWSQGLRSP